jgi:hypothetical protein
MTSQYLPTCGEAKKLYESAECCGKPENAVYVPTYTGECGKVMVMTKFNIYRELIYENINIPGVPIPMTTAAFFGAALGGGTEDGLWRFWNSTLFPNKARRAGFTMIYENEEPYVVPDVLYGWNQTLYPTPVVNLSNIEVYPSCSSFVSAYAGFIGVFLGLSEPALRFFQNATFDVMIPPHMLNDQTSCVGEIFNPDGTSAGTRTLADVITAYGSTIPSALAPYMNRYDQPTTRFIPANAYSTCAGEV